MPGLGGQYRPDYPYIAETAKWTKFLSIIGFVFVGFFVLLAIVMMVFLPMLNEEMQELSNMPLAFGPAIGIVYILIAGLYMIPILYLFKFSTKTLDAIKSNDENMLAEAFKNLKSHYKFMGIFTIIFLAIYLLILVGGFFAGFLGAF